jgi:membrane associated rhomboid family serine protease
VHCPECVREQRAQFKQTRRTVGPSGLTVARRRLSMLDQKATYAIIAVTVLIWLIQEATGGVSGPVTAALGYDPSSLATQPWRLVTTMFVHEGFLHIALNMWALWLFGRMLEQMIGAWRFLALYFISGIAGSMAVSLIAPHAYVIGASGAIFGLFGCFFVIQRSLGGNAVQLLVVIGVNLAIGLVVSGIAWQAHVGGVAAGFLTGYIFTKTRAIRHKGLQIGLLSAEAVVAVVLSYVGYALYF